MSHSLRALEFQKTALRAPNGALVWGVDQFDENSGKYVFKLYDGPDINAANDMTDSVVGPFQPASGVAPEVVGFQSTSETGAFTVPIGATAFVVTNEGAENAVFAGRTIQPSQHIKEHVTYAGQRFDELSGDATGTVLVVDIQRPL